MGACEGLRGVSRSALLFSKNSTSLETCLAYIGCKRRGKVAGVDLVQRVIETTSVTTEGGCKNILHLTTDLINLGSLAGPFPQHMVLD